MTNGVRLTAGEPCAFFWFLTPSMMGELKNHEAPGSCVPESGLFGPTLGAGETSPYEHLRKPLNNP